MWGLNALIFSHLTLRYVIRCCLMVPQKEPLIPFKKRYKS